MSEESTDPVQWLNDLPEALRTAPYFKPPEDGSHRTVEQVVADLTNAAQLQGNLSESHVKIPSPDAADTDKAAFRERILGIDPGLTTKPEDYSPVPENADGYEAPAIDGFDMDLSQVRETALAQKWTQAQFNGFVQQLAGETKASQDQRAIWLSDQQKVLTEKLGAAKADHLARTVAAVKDINPDLASAIQDGTLDANTVMALDTLVHKMIDMGGEGNEFNAMAGAGARQPTPDEALNSANELRHKLTTERLSGAERNRLEGQLVEYQKLARGR